MNKFTAACKTSGRRSNSNSPVPCKQVAQAVKSERLRDSALLDGSFEQTLNGRFMKMMTPFDACVRLTIPARCGKNPLLSPFPIRIRVLFEPTHPAKPPSRRRPASLVRAVAGRGSDGAEDLPGPIVVAPSGDLCDPFRLGREFRRA